MADTIVFNIRDQVGHILINREPQLNALNGEALEGLSILMEQLEGMCTGPDAFKECRVVTLRGAGSKAFVAGADIKFMRQASPLELRRFIELGQRVMRQIEVLPLPVIAVVDGYAIGGGMELALAADLVCVTERAKFGQAEVNLGVIPGFGGTQRLQMRTGIGPARRLILTAETIGAEEARSLGIADWLVPSSEVDSHVEKICSMIRAKAPLALAATKRAIRAGLDAAWVHGFGIEREEFLALFRSEDAKEGVSAFVEKREAKFIGR